MGCLCQIDDDGQYWFIFVTGELSPGFRMNVFNKLKPFPNGLSYKTNLLTGEYSACFYVKFHFFYNSSSFF